MRLLMLIVIFAFPYLVRAFLGDRKWQALNRFLRDLREALRTNPKWQDKVGDKLLGRNLVLLNDLLP